MGGIILESSFAIGSEELYLKLLFAIVQNDDQKSLTYALIEQNISVTRIASTGGFLRGGILFGSGQRDSPAKFIYRLRPEMPTTEVAIHSRPSEDHYVIMATVDPMTRRATFQVKVRPLVWWIWFGGMMMGLGGLLAAFDKRYRVKVKTRVREALGLNGVAA